MITSWGSECATQIKKIQTNPKSCYVIYVFGHLVWTRYSTYWIHLMLRTFINCSFLSLLLTGIPKKLPNIFSQHVCDTSEVDAYNTRYASITNFYKSKNAHRTGNIVGNLTKIFLKSQIPGVCPGEGERMSVLGFD